MVLRISRLSHATPRLLLKLEGRLVAEWAVLLERECAEILGLFGAVDIDVSDVTFIDRSGVDSLGRLHGAGVTIRGCSDLMASILEAEGIRVERL